MRGGRGIGRRYVKCLSRNLDSGSEETFLQVHSPLAALEVILDCFQSRFLRPWHTVLHVTAPSCTCSFLLLFWSFVLCSAFFSSL